MNAPDTSTTASEAETARSLRLRGPAPRVTRLSRRTLAISGAVLAVALAGSIGWSLSSRRKAPAQPQTTTVVATPPEAVTAQPKDYIGRADAPVLGPPLPGDLGRPIVNSARSVEATGALPAPAGVASINAPPPVEKPVDAGREAALFAAFSTARTAPPTPAQPAPRSDPGPDPRATSPERLSPPPSPFTLMAGSVLPAVLVTGLRSDAPGVAVAQVERDVFDSLGRGVLLIPAGARLIGTYDTEVASGAGRLRVRWTRLIRPDGRGIQLDDLPAADPQGMAGLRDSVDRHGRQVLGAAALSTILALGMEAGNTEGDADLVRALRRGGARTASDVGQQIVSQALGQPPVLTVRAGAPLNVILTRDLVLEPYQTREIVQ